MDFGIDGRGGGGGYCGDTEKWLFIMDIGIEEMGSIVAILEKGFFFIYRPFKALLKKVLWHNSVLKHMMGESA